MYLLDLSKVLPKVSDESSKYRNDHYGVAAPDLKAGIRLGNVKSDILSRYALLTTTEEDDQNFAQFRKLLLDLIKD